MFAGLHGEHHVVESVVMADSLICCAESVAWSTSVPQERLLLNVKSIWAVKVGFRLQLKTTVIDSNLILAQIDTLDFASDNFT
jgi:hypothetical protein